MEYQDTLKELSKLPKDEENDVVLKQTFIDYYSPISAQYVVQEPLDHVFKVETCSAELRVGDDGIHLDAHPLDIKFKDITLQNLLDRISTLEVEILQLKSKE